MKREVTQTIKEKSDDLYGIELDRTSKAYQKYSKHFLNQYEYIPSKRRYNLTVSHEEKFIWFRVAKVCTRTIFNELEASNISLDAKHPYNCYYPINLYEDYFKFGFVRNPFDRLVSCWKNKVIHSNHFNFTKHLLSKMQDFNYFVEFLSQQDVESCDPHLRLQSSLVDVNEVDFIGRFENFNQDLHSVLEIIGVDVRSIGHKNSSGTNSSYKDFYNESLVRSVSRIYQKDIQVFGYHF